MSLKNRGWNTYHTLYEIISLNFIPAYHFNKIFKLSNNIYFDTELCIWAVVDLTGRFWGSEHHFFIINFENYLATLGTQDTGRRQGKQNKKHHTEN
jgi:hypothetical protein